MHAFTLSPKAILICALALTASLAFSETSFARRGHYKRRGNVYCKDNPPKSQKQTLEAAGVKLGNPRSPFVTEEIANYVIQLQKKCGHAKLQSGWRDCSTNRRVGGVSKSRHLSGRAADTTSGCGHGGSRQVCQASKLHYVNEGPRRFPHCQMR